jgi:LysM repeat protein
VPVALTRRGQWVVVALAVLAAFLLLSLGQVAAQAIGHDAVEGSPTQGTWVVQPGETLWSIAERVDPGTDPRETVARLVAINDLPDSSVQVGQELQIPA